MRNYYSRKHDSFRLLFIYASVLFYLAGDFPRAWALLLELIELSALCQNSEVSLAALKSFQEILQLNSSGSASSGSNSSGASGGGDDLKMLFMPNAPGEERIQRSGSEEPKQKAQIKKSKSPTPVPTSELVVDKDSGLDAAPLWANAWRVWLSIGTAVTTPPETSHAPYVPAQPFLTALIQIFPALYAQMRTR